MFAPYTSFTPRSLMTAMSRSTCRVQQRSRQAPRDEITQHHRSARTPHHLEDGVDEHALLGRGISQQVGCRGPAAQSVVSSVSVDTCPRSFWERVRTVCRAAAGVEQLPASERTGAGAQREASARRRRRACAVLDRCGSGARTGISGPRGAARRSYLSFSGLRASANTNRERRGGRSARRVITCVRGGSLGAC